MKNISTIISCALLTALGCRQIPKATPQEITQRDRWAAMVSSEDRQRITDEAERHGDWGEKRKIRFEIEHFNRLANKQRVARATQPAATQPTSGPSLPQGD